MVGLSNSQFTFAMRVYVILFNARTDNEGIHSVRAEGHDLIYMFADEDDATRYAMMLEAQDLPTPAVEPLDSQEIEEFCADSNYECVLIEQGMLVVPPENNLMDTDWQSDGQHRQTTGKDAEKNADQSQDPNDGVDYDRIRRQLEGLL
jgi:Protein of unknown function (DUF3110)